MGINWFMDKLGLIENPQEMSALAAEAGGTGGAEGVYFVSAFGGLLAPYWSDDARGALVGLTLRHEKKHVCQAVLEGIAFQVEAVVRAMVRDTGGSVVLGQMRVDGGVSQSAPLLEAAADFLGVDVVRPHNVETTALGAAIAAGAGAGLWSRYEDAPTAAEETHQDLVVPPQIGAEERRERCAHFAAAVEASKGWAGKR